MLKLKLISQLPEGSIPTFNLDQLKLEDITLRSMSTTIKTFNFYFPQPGEFDYFPATIMSKNRFVTHAVKMEKLRVVKKFQRGGKKLENL
jgi:hypothetical protein